MTVVQCAPQNIEKYNDVDNIERMLKSAVAYAKFLQWHVFPVHSVIDEKCTCHNPNCSQIAKHPITRNGLKDATTDLQTIQKWWTDYPGANIGIRTGEESGIFVLDVDTHKVDGKATLEALEEKHDRLPDTVQAITGSGGLHYLFKYQKGIRNKVNFEPGLDVRADGGYIVASPSLHASGNCYSWELSSRPLEHEIADAPQWLIEKIVEPSKTQGNIPQPKPSSYWQKLMQGLKEHEGRNPAATSIVGHLLSRKVDLLLVYEMMHLWNQRNDPPLKVDELNTVIASIARKEFERRGR